MLTGRYSLIRSQYLQLKRQLPWAYVSLAFSTFALAFLHRDAAPHLIGRTLPLLLVAAALARAAYWFNSRSSEVAGDEEAKRRLLTISVLGPFIGMAFTLWALILSDFSGGVNHGYVTVYIALALFGTLVCLLHVPRAAVATCVAVLGPLVCHTLVAGHFAETAMAFNMALVAGIVTWVLADSQRVFAELVHSQHKLADKRRVAGKLNDENLRLALTDHLTAMPNRRAFQRKLREMLEARQTTDQSPFCVAMLDLDQFKPVNDSYGHVVGDKVLVEIARRLMARSNSALFVSRLGGDEFGILFDGPQPLAERAIVELSKDIRQPVDIHDHQLRIGCSVGMAVYPDAGVVAETLFDRSDYALYHGKSTSRGSCVVFAEEHELAVRHAQRIESALQSADLERELTVHFQPIYDARTMSVTSVEALARWHSPTLGAVDTEKMIQAAERSGKINEITLHLFSKALIAFHKLPKEISLSFNLSAEDIASTTTVRELIAMVVATRLPPQRFIFEVTETSLVRDLDSAREVLGRLRTLGMRVALDDFGTGYSSLGTLHDLPLDIVKVDRSFAEGMASKSGRQIVSAIRNLAQSLGLECTMEGIESEAQLVETSLIGYRYAQGFLLGRPMPIDELLSALPQSLGAPLPKALGRRTPA